ncbi:nuclease-related domain-containing protein [Rhodococcus jostii]
MSITSLVPLTVQPWHVLHSRALHNTAADADDIVIGPGGVVLVDSKYRSGRFECHPWVAEDGSPAPTGLTTELRSPPIWWDPLCSRPTRSP